MDLKPASGKLVELAEIDAPVYRVEIDADEREVLSEDFRDGEHLVEVLRLCDPAGWRDRESVPERQQVEVPVERGALVAGQPVDVDMDYPAAPGKDVELVVQRKRVHAVAQVLLREHPPRDVAIDPLLLDRLVVGMEPLRTGLPRWPRGPPGSGSRTTLTIAEPWFALSTNRCGRPSKLTPRRSSIPHGVCGKDTLSPARARTKSRMASLSATSARTGSRSQSFSALR